MRIANSSVRRSFILIALVLLALLVFAGPALTQQTNWIASYWNNTDLSGPPAVQQIESQAPDIGWGHESPVPGIQSDYWSARWTADQYFDPGQYRFTLRTDDGARLWVNNQKILDIDETGIDFTADIDIKTAGTVPIMLEFYEEKGNAGVHLTWERIGNIASTGPIRAEYYNNKTMEGSPALIRNEGPGLYHQWGNDSPAPGIINSDEFSARYTQAMNLEPGWYRFTARADNGIRFWVNNQLLINKWEDPSSDPVSADVYLPGGIVNFLVHYFENIGGARISLTMTKLEEGSSGGSGGGYGGGTDSSGGSGGGYGGGSGGSYPGPDSGSGGSGGGYGGGSSSSGGSGGGYGGGSGGSTVPPASTSATVNTTALNMRSGPGTEYEPIRTLYMGDVVTLTGLYEGYWVHVHTMDNFAGWVSSQYLDYNMPVGDSSLSNKG